jgi:hypothetical protein
MRLKRFWLWWRFRPRQRDPDWVTPRTRALLRLIVEHGGRLPAEPDSDDAA